MRNPDHPGDNVRPADSLPPSARSPSAPLMPPRWTPWVAAGLLLGFLGLTVSSVLRKSATWDETHYLGAGQYVWTTHQWEAPDSLLHPVLWTVVHDLPLLAFDVPAGVASEPDGYGRGQALMALRADDRVLNACRLSLLPFALGLGLLVFVWSRRLHGDAGGLLSLALFCLCPNLIAHSALVTPDVTLAAFTTLVAWRLWCLARDPGRRNLVLCGLATGGLLLTKHTALLLLPILCATDLVQRAFSGTLQPRTLAGFWRGVRHWPAILCLGFLVVWAGYGLQVGALELPDGGRIPVFAPPYFQGALFQYLQSRGEHAFFLMGMHSNSGWWYYYVVVGLLKLPLPVLLLAGGLACGGRKLGLRFRAEEIYLIGPLLLLFLYLSCFNTIHNGLRYLLPVYPLLLIQLGRYGDVVQRLRWVRYAVFGLVGWLVLSALLVWPHYLAYFNELAGGPRQGYHWLGDSNVDWGQDLKELKRFMDRHGIQRVRLSYFGTADPAHYGVAYEYMPSRNSALRPTPPRPEGERAPRFIAISAYQYQGIGFRPPNFYQDLYQYEPNEVLGGSILVFDTENLIRRTTAPWPARLRSGWGEAPALDSAP
jgi:hypothetical protein